MVCVTAVTVTRDPGLTRLSGCIDAHRISYDLPPWVKAEPRAEPFLALALLKAMLVGERLVLDWSAPLDPKLSSRLAEIQATYRLWSPGLSSIDVDVASTRPPSRAGGVISGFSGGVDGSATLADHLDEIDLLLTLDCYDSANAEERTAVQARVASIAQALGKRSVFVSTDVRARCEQLGISWFYMHGPTPCLLAAALGMDRFYMPSSYTYAELKPWGSHPVLDPLWSTTVTEVVHDGGWRRRSEKIALIAETPVLLSNLQVCYRSQVENCGQCAKCVRTTVALAAMGIAAASFPPVTLARQVARLTIEHDLNASFVHDLMRLLADTGERGLARRLGSKLRRFRRGQAWRRFRRNLLSPHLAAPLRRLQRAPKRSDRLGVADPDDSIV